MRPAIALKTLYRSPGKTVITFLLLAVLTFSLFLQVAEYHATAKEFAENVGMYYGTGYVEKAPASYTGYRMLRFPYYIATDKRINTSDLPDFSCYKYPSLTAEEVYALSALPYVSTTACRYMTAGRSSYARVIEDYGLWDYTSRAIVEGTLVGSCTNGMDYSQPAYTIRDRVVLGGDMELSVFSNLDQLRARIGLNPAFSDEVRRDMLARIPEEENLTFFTAFPYAHVRLYPVDFLGDDYLPVADLEDHNFKYINVGGQSWEINQVLLKNYDYGDEAQQTWNIDGRYVYVFRFSHNPKEHQGLTAQLYDWTSEHFCRSVWDVTGAPENYLELPKYAPLKELIEITNSDLYTLDVVYADDMSTIKQIQNGTMTLSEGRWLTQEDTECGNMVCMLDQKFAQKYRLHVGDTLPLELGDALFEQFYNLGAIASTVERYADNWTPAEFEIVGLYQTSGSAFSAAKEPNWSYSVNTVFVPLSALPETVDLTDHEYAPGEFTFRVDNAWNIAPFLEETAPRIEEMGLTLMFDDGGWMEVYKPYMEAQRIVMLRIILLAAITVMATAFVVYLFISRKRMDYAIMRALGTPKGKSNSSLLLPLMVLTAFSVAVGLTTSTVYVARAGTMGTPSAGLVLLCGGAELLLALLLALLMLHGLSRKSPLALLQGGTNARRGAQRATAPSVGRDDPARRAVGACEFAGDGRNGMRDLRRAEIVTPYEKVVCRPRPIRFTLRYIFRHIRRSAVKSLLSVLVAALMLAAVAQLGHMRIVYDQLQLDTVVTAKFNMSLVTPKLKQLETDGLTSRLYYERHLNAVLVNGPEPPTVDVVVTNDIERYVGVPCEFTYIDGHGSEDQSVVGKYAVVGVDLMEMLDLAPGDTLHLSKEKETQQFLIEQLSRLYNEHPEMPLSFDAMFQLYPEEIAAAMDEFCDTLTVIGTVSTGNSTFDSLVYTGGMESTKKFANDNLLEYVEFRVPDNARAAEMKQRGEEMTGHRQGAFSIDIEKLESVERTANLLETLYPIVVALTLIIGAFLCALIILQTAKDAAIMRIQGTTAAMTRAILAVEQLLLAVLGVGIGVAVMAAIKGQDFPLIAVRALTFGGAYIVVAAVASIVSAVLATRKNLLELLQTKE